MLILSQQLSVCSAPLYTFRMRHCNSICTKQSRLKMWALFLLVFSFGSTLCDVCPKECDCDVENGLNRATCVDQNIISVAVGVPKPVQVYSLRRNVISELENFCFKELGYTSIQVLDVSYNQIFWIGLHAFAGLDQLVNLNLSNNRLRYFSSDIFWHTLHLDILDLSANVFESLKNEPFIIHNKLQVLNLNSCRIKSLPDRAFTRLPNLRKLDASENYLVSISVEVLRPLRRLTRLELKNDYWQCNPHFIDVESWIASRGIAYERMCKSRSATMSERIISTVRIDREPVDVDGVWNVTKGNATVLTAGRNETERLTPLQRFDRRFPALQAFVVGLEVGLAIGVVATFVWLRRVCALPWSFRRPPNRRRRMRRAGDMRNHLLWSAVAQANVETPPIYRRRVLPEAQPPRARGGSPESRAETPPPPYNECRLAG